MNQLTDYFLEVGDVKRLLQPDVVDLAEILASARTDVNYKRNIDIVQQDRDGTTLRRWSLSRAWPVKFVAGDWDNESDENVIESVTLTFDFFELIQ